MSEIRKLRVGGPYWSSQPPLRSSNYALIKVANARQREQAIEDLPIDQPVVLWTDSGDKPASEKGRPIDVIAGECDPWHLLDEAALVITDEDDELGLLATIAKLPVKIVNSAAAWTFCDVYQRAIQPFEYVDPFTGEPIAILEAVRLCGFWRQLIESNRAVGSAVGFAFWKRSTVAPLLWEGSSTLRFASRAKDVDFSRAVAVWKARTPASLLRELETRGVNLIEVEDGFIRSSGLGADCVPPLSIVVDRLGVHFDPSKPSELERLIQEGPFPTELLERAAQLRELIVASGIGKYGAGKASLDRPDGTRIRILVPGQVEDDRAVLCSGGLSSNLELLRCVREQRRDAHIIYKPHPDVEAGHRAGTIADDECLEFADEIVRDQPISSLIDAADEVHVMSSLAGFEALLRGKPVTTYGAPFYAGWGLTQEIGPIPERRSARRTLDELVAAVLLLYPRYLDPMTGLPCPPEVLVRRLAERSSSQGRGVVVQLRRLQGRWKKRFARAGQS